jgi:hypothetical protein
MTSSASDIAADADSAFARRLAPSPSTQLTLNLPAPPATAETPLVPVRMVNEWVYCPRLAFLEWVDGEWADSGDTEEGRRAHVRVDAGGGKLPAPAETHEKPDFTARSVTLASERLGIIAKIDVIDGEGGTVTPVRRHERQSLTCGWSPRPAGFRRRWLTAQNAPNVRSQVSACRTKSPSSDAGWRRAR